VSASKPLAERFVLLARLAILIAKTDPNRNPDQRFNIVPVHVLDAAFDG